MLEALLLDRVAPIKRTFSHFNASIFQKPELLLIYVGYYTKARGYGYASNFDEFESKTRFRFVLVNLTGKACCSPQERDNHSQLLIKPSVISYCMSEPRNEDITCR